MSIPGKKVEIVINKVERASDGMGGYRDVYTQRYKLMAGFHSLTAQERLLAGRESSSVTNRVFMPYKPDIENSDRVVYGGKTYEIIAIVNPGNVNGHLELDLHLVE